MSVTNLIFPYGETLPWQLPEQIERLPQPPLRDWLLATGSLTEKLKAHCHHFKVEVLGEQLVEPLSGESSPTHRVWMREVLLYLDDTPWVFANTLVPYSLLHNCNIDFLTLGSRPLGERLFESNTLTPQKIEVIQFNPVDALAKLIEVLGQKSQPLWGRRRYFGDDSQQLVVSEIFLPEAQRLIGKLKQ